MMNMLFLNRIDRWVVGLFMLTGPVVQAAYAPLGAGFTATMEEDNSYLFQAGDFGFSDPADAPPDAFKRIKITSLPAKGALTSDGLQVQAGDFVSMVPEAGGVWTAQTFGGMTSLASSADGLKLLGGTSGGQLWRSTDAGVTWTPRGISSNWVAVASSGNGTTLAAIQQNGRIYTSSNSGVTWTPGGATRDWRSITCSADGTKLVALAFGDLIYTSDDYGITWVPRASAGSWTAVACSSDGRRILAANSMPSVASGLYWSADFGLSWTRVPLPPESWTSISVSSDGLKAIAVGFNGARYRSQDGGLTWEGGNSGKSWLRSASSADGTRLILAEYQGQLYTSVDSGLFWRPVAARRIWASVASSADGTRLAASTALENLYTSIATVPSLIFTPEPDANGIPYADFSFQVEDSGALPDNLDASPDLCTLNVNSVNDPPVSLPGMADQGAEKHRPFSYQFPPEIFQDKDPGSMLSFSAQLANGMPLPRWLAFDPASRTFSGIPGNADVGVLEIKVTATDNGIPLLAAYSRFSLTVPGTAPAGTDRTLTIDEDTPYLFSPADFGFSDGDDSPPNALSRVKITTKATAGSLTIDGIAVRAGETVSFLPDSRMGWTPRDASRYWSKVVSSADGSKLAAYDANQKIYTSDDSGQTWIPRDSNRSWSGLATSADGMKLVACNAGGFLYTSWDSGATWIPRETARNWSGVASSTDGVRLIASDLQGRLYLSVDSGVTWTARGAAKAWTFVESSADGNRLAAVDRTFNAAPSLYTSIDAGVTWVAAANPRGQFASISAMKMSSYGVQLWVVDGGLWESSDRGASWTSRATDFTIEALAISATGQRQLAIGSTFTVNQEKRLYTSSDGGRTWSPRESNNRWSCVASSADGLKLVAGAGLGKLYTSVAAVPELKFTPAANAFGTLYGSFTFQVGDDGMVGPNLDPTPNTFGFNVNPVNDAPRLRSLPDGTATERAAISGYTVFAASDAEPGDILTYSATQADGAPLPGWLRFNPATRSFSGTPQTMDTGILDMLVTVTDNGLPPLSNTTPLRFYVNNVDDPPSGRSLPVYLANESSYTFSPGDFGFSDQSDRPANEFTRVKLSTLPLRGSLAINGVPATAGEFCALQNVPLGAIWTPRETNRFWYSIASSSNGVKLAAVVKDGRIYLSTDSGATWSPRESIRSWYGIASSADGVKLVAVAGDDRPDRIYTSVDSGQNWTPRGQGGYPWRSVTSSADGTKLAAAATNGSIYISADSGVTWTFRESNRAWYSVTSSSDGVKLAAVVRGGLIYTSIDSGVTWTPRENVREWIAITSSADGTRLAATVSNGMIYVSADSGVTWSPRESNRAWYAITSSADGNKLAAVVSSGRIYLSEDSGSTWIPRVSNQDWRTVSFSPDGTRLAAGAVGGQIYTTAINPAQILSYSAGAGNTTNYADSFSFQVEDDGAPGSNLDPAPKPLTLNVFMPSPFTSWAMENHLPPDPGGNGGANLLNFGFGLSAANKQSGPILLNAGAIVQAGFPTLLPGSPEFTVLFGRRKSGATFTVQFSADLSAWENSTTAPMVIAEDEHIEACTTAFPQMLSDGRKPRFFRVSVASP